MKSEEFELTPTIIGRTFTITEVELKTAEKWIENHADTCERIKKRREDNGRVAIPVSAISYKFTGTSMGSLVSVCCKCGEEYDITDVSCW